MAKPDHPEAPTHRNANVKVHSVNEPARLCSNCQHWERRVGARGLCHNLIGKSIMTSGPNDTCAKGFYPSVERFPLERRYHEGARP